MFLVTHCRASGDRWIIGASRIQDDRLWEIDSLQSKGTEEILPFPRADQKTKRHLGIDALSDDGLDALPYGVIQLSVDGKILKYNQFESDFAQLRKEQVIGRNFFLEVAPCTAVKEFQGRFKKVTSTKGHCATFEFTYELHSKSHPMLVTLLYNERTCTVWLFAQRIRPVETA